MSAGTKTPARTAIAAAVLLCSVAGLAQTPGSSPVGLRDDQAVTAGARSGEPAVYSFDASAEESYLLRVDQQGLDFRVTLETPAGDSRSFDSPLRRDESEYVLFEADGDGPYRITVESGEPTNAEGAFTIRVRAYGESSGADPRHMAAWQVMTDAAAANAAGDRPDAERARDLYVDAADRWRALGENRLQAQALYSAGMLEYWQLENWHGTVLGDETVKPGAMEYADAAAGLYRMLGEDSLYANTIFLRAYARIETASGVEQVEKDAVFDRALSTFDEALDIHTRLGNRFERAHILNFIGITHWYRADRDRADYETARNYYNRSVELFSSIGEWREELNGLNNIVVLDSAEGRILAAIDSFERFLSRLPADASPRLRATMLANLGLAHFAFGNIDEALRFSSEAHSIAVSIGDRTAEGASLRSIGQTYFAIGDYESAQRYLVQARDLAESANDYRTQANIESILGNVAFAAGDYETALQRHRTAIELSSSAENAARRKLLLAKDFAALGRYSDAITQATAARDESGSEVTQADARLALALSHLETGDAASAQRLLDEAMGTYERLSLLAQQGDALHAYALVASARGDMDAAVEYGRASLDLIESLRERLAHPELRALNSATRRAYYEDQVALLMRLHEASGREDSPWLREALTTNERGRARLSLDLLNEAAVDLDGRMDPALIAERRALYGALAEKRQQQERAESGAETARLSAEMDAIENELNLLETEYRRANPEYFSFQTPKTLDAAQIQQRIDPDSVLLQYAVGEDQSFLWAVTSDSIRGVRLPDRATIDAVASIVHSELGRLPSVRDQARLQESLNELAGYVLAKTQNVVQSKARLVIAADGALQYVPFAVLPVSVAGVETPLIAARDDREIVNIVSVSALAMMERTRNVASPPNLVAVFADPVMETRDSRFESTVGAVASSTDAALTRSLEGPRLGRIPNTEKEAAAIAKLSADARKLMAVGFDATLDAVVNGRLGDYRYIHFATHGIVDSEHPSLSALALSQYDRGRERRPGFLHLHDIYALDLNADLVVLSACDTALGREIRGEGLIGLTQGFMYAGARNIVASLWQIQDLATADLMERFYENLLEDGLSPSQSLAAAQRSMLAEHSGVDPFYWGPFIIQGDL